MRISIVVPAHNEEDNIVNLIKKIEETLRMEHELLIINDHSTDKTRQLIEQESQRYSNIRVMDNESEKGFANALRFGFANTSADVVIPVMADLCDDLQAIRKMADKIDEGYDVVCGSRYTGEGARLGGSKLKGFLSCFAGRSLHYFLGVPTYDIANAFKMYRKKVLDNIEIKSSSFEISMEIPLKAYYLGYKITEVPTVWHERTKGKSSFKVFKLLPNYMKLYIWAIGKRIKGLIRR